MLYNIGVGRGVKQMLCSVNKLRIALKQMQVIIQNLVNRMLQIPYRVREVGYGLWHVLRKYFFLEIVLWHVHRKYFFLGYTLWHVLRKYFFVGYRLWHVLRFFLFFGKPLLHVPQKNNYLGYMPWHVPQCERQIKVLFYGLKSLNNNI